jgi:hypothetical protein
MSILLTVAMVIGSFFLLACIRAVELGRLDLGSASCTLLIR